MADTVVEVNPDGDITVEMSSAPVATVIETLTTPIVVAPMSETAEIVVVTGQRGPANSLTIGSVTVGPVAASITGASPNQVLNLVLPSGVSDHGALTGLADDDHPQYLNNVRGDAKYTQLGHTHAAVNISDSTPTGRSVLTAVDVTSARAAIGAGTSSLVIGTTASTAKAGDYQPTAANISDSTATGRLVITAVDAAGARAAIGAGTGSSNLSIGTTSTTAKAGNYAPPVANETQTGIVELATAAETTTGTDGTRAVHPAGLKVELDKKATLAHTHSVTSLTATGTKDATTFLRGDNTWAVPPGGAGGGTVTAANITDATVVGRNVLTAVDAPAARTAIGAGTSNLAIGTTSATAKAGDYQPTSANITDATSAPTANMVIKRDAAGRAQVASPNVAADIAPKDYVDTQVATRIPAFADPNADRMVFWDDSAGTWAPLTPNTGISIAGNSLDVAISTVNGPGIVELATGAEVTTGTDTTRAVTPAGLKVELDKKVTGVGLFTFEKITQAAYDALVTAGTTGATTAYVIQG